jgi:triacylglycerol lipase
MGGVSDIQSDDLKNIPTFRAAYSDRTALLMAKLAFCAYEGFHIDEAALAKFRADFGKIGLDLCQSLVDPDTGTAGYIVAAPDLIVVVFRGTENLLDWRTNVRLAWVALQGDVRFTPAFSKPIGQSASPCSKECES